MACKYHGTLKLNLSLVLVLLLSHYATAGVLQSMKEAGFLKEIIADSLGEATSAINSLNEKVSRSLKSLEENSADQSSSINNIAAPQDAEKGSFFDKYYYNLMKKQQEEKVKPCFPGDFLCHAQRSFKATVGNEMSNAIVKTVATLMTDMLNTTISRSLDLMRMAQHEQDQGKKEAEARQAVTMVGNALGSVSTKVIQGFASFVKLSLSGSLSDFLGQVTSAAARSSMDNGSQGIISGLGSSLNALGGLFSTVANSDLLKQATKTSKSLFSDSILQATQTTPAPLGRGNLVKILINPISYAQREQVELNNQLRRNSEDIMHV